MTESSRPPWYEAATAPRSIAVIGASATPAKNHHQQQLAIYGYKGAVYPINPREAMIDGVKAYPSILDVPAAVDLVMIALPAHAAPAAVEQCVQAGVRLIYLFASGFSESGEEGREREQQIRAILARSQGRTRMLGPNGTGILSLRADMVATPLGARRVTVNDPRDDGVAIISQSGLIASVAFLKSQQDFPAVGTSFAIGNEADLGLADAIEAMVQDDAISVILVYLEGLRDPARFIEAARRARAAGKPVVVLKGGATSAGAAAAATHTASVSGADHVMSGVLAQAGVRRAVSVAHLLDVAKVLRACPDFAGGGATILTSSGGLGIMATDLLVTQGFTLAPWAPAQAARMRAALPEFVSVANPLDGTGDFAWARAPLEEAIRSANDNPATDFILITLGGLPDAEAPVAAALQGLVKLTRKPVFVAWVGGMGTALRELNKAGIPAFGDLRSMVDALALAVRQPAGVGAMRPATLEPDVHLQGEIASLLKADPGGRRANLDEVDSKALLKLAGIPVIEEGVAANADAAARVAASIGYPVVMKLRAPGLMHKSELNAVSLGVAGDAQVREQAQRLLAIARDQGIAQADLVVQRQVPPGLELLIGLHHDATFGRVITFGMGGVLTEALADVQCFLPDVNEAEFMRALAALRHQKLLAGYRHLPAVDARVIWPLVQRFAALARALPHTVREIDVNPLIVEPGGRAVVAVDALVVLDPHAGQA